MILWSSLLEISEKNQEKIRIPDSESMEKSKNLSTYSIQTEKWSENSQNSVSAVGNENKEYITFSKVENNIEKNDFKETTSLWERILLGMYFKKAVFR